MEKSNKNKQDPFADYMWMENMDDFDRQIEEQLVEEEFIRACIEQLLEEEDERETLTAAEIIAQQQLQGKDSAQQGAPQGSFRNGFQGNSAYSNGYTNGYGKHDYSVVVSSRIASYLNDSLLCHCHLEYMPEVGCVCYRQVEEHKFNLFNSIHVIFRSKSTKVRSKPMLRVCENSAYMYQRSLC